MNYTPLELRLALIRKRAHEVRRPVRSREPHPEGRTLGSSLHLKLKESACMQAIGFWRLTRCLFHRDYGLVARQEKRIAVPPLTEISPVRLSVRC